MFDFRNYSRSVGHLKRFLSYFIYDDDDDEYFVILFVIVVRDGDGGRCFALNHIKQSCGSLGNNNK